MKQVKLTVKHTKVILMQVKVTVKEDKASDIDHRPIQGISDAYQGHCEAVIYDVLRSDSMELMILRMEENLHVICDPTLLLQ